MRFFTSLAIALWCLLYLLSVVATHREKRQLFDVGLCVSPNASCIALSECRIVAELMDRQCLVPGRLKDMTCGYSNATRQPLVCCPSMDTGLAKPGTIPDYTSGGGDDDGNDPSTGDVELGSGVVGGGSSTGSGEVEGGTSSSGGSGLPIFNVCGQPQLIVGSPPRIPNLAGPTRLGAHPWVVRLGHRNVNSGVTEFYGAGVIITDRHVLTAAHCLNMKGSGFRLATVRVGEYETTTNPDCSNSLCAISVKDVPILRTAMHPNYDESTFNHDIMVVTLQYKVNFTVNIQPACVMTRASANLVGRRALVVGYGRLATSQKVQTTQQALEVPIVPSSQCQRFYSQASVSLDNRVCAGGEQGRDMCQGFSGAPLFVRAVGVGAFFVAGIRAYGSDQCGNAGAVNVYTSVARYTAFIRNNILLS